MENKKTKYETPDFQKRLFSLEEAEFDVLKASGDGVNEDLVFIDELLGN